MAMGFFVVALHDTVCYLLLIDAKHRLIHFLRFLFSTCGTVFFFFILRVYVCECGLTWNGSLPSYVYLLYIYLAIYFLVVLRNFCCYWCHLQRQIDYGWLHTQQMIMQSTQMSNLEIVCFPTVASDFLYLIPLDYCGRCSVALFFFSSFGSFLQPLL